MKGIKVEMEELDLKEIIYVFWTKKIQIVLVVSIFIVIGAIYSFGFITPLYKSSTTLVLAKIENDVDPITGESTITSSDLTLNSKLVSTYSELVKSKKVLRAVISNLGIQMNEDSLRKSVSVSSVKDTELIEITITNADPAVAAKIANETAKVFTENVTEMYNINNVHIVDEAEVSSNPSNIHHTKNIAIFAVIGVVVSCAYVLLLNMLDTTIKSVEEVEKLLNKPVLASIPIYDFEGKNDKGGDIR